MFTKSKIKSLQTFLTSYQTHSTVSWLKVPSMSHSLSVTYYLIDIVCLSLKIHLPSEGSLQGPFEGKLLPNGPTR